jgi:multiple sugar transport system substrate-binding protein
VLGGLAIPTTSKRVTEAKSLISYLSGASVETAMLNDESWFPPVGSSALPTSLAPGVAAEAKAINATNAAAGAIASRLPVGLGSQSAAYDKVFTDTFTAIALNGAPIPSTLASEGATLQSVLTQAKAACWAPDPTSSGVCQVG